MDAVAVEQDGVENVHASGSTDLINPNFLAAIGLASCGLSQLREDALTRGAISRTASEASAKSPQGQGMEV
jgi:hypothetical protein